MSPLENLYDMLEKTGVAFHISDWHKSDAENFAAAESAIKGGARFLFVYTAELDALLHEHVGDFKTVEKKLAAYAEKIRFLLGVCKAQCPNFRLTVVSDHGMTPLKKTVDAMSTIEKTGLVFGRDYGACYDSTMARFTYVSDCAKGTIERAMSAFDDCGHFLSEAEQRRYGVYRADGFFGDAIFLFEAGIQISPSDMGVRPLNGGSRPPRSGGGRGGYQNRDRGGRGRNDRPRGDRPAAPSRPPRSDAASASRYGKIEPLTKHED